MNNVKLSEIFELQMGKTPARNNPVFWSGENKWISISDLGNCHKFIFQTKETISNEGIKNSGIKKVPKNTVIMSFKLSIGKTAITTDDMYTNEAIMAFIDKKKYQININYIYHLFSNFNWALNTNKAVMGLVLNKAKLSQIKIPIPSIKEQNYIANVLDKIDDIINLRRTQLNKLDLLVKSRFNEMFGDIRSSKKYTYVVLESLTKVFSGGTPDRKNISYWKNGNINWIKTTELKNNVIYSSEEKITIEGLNNCSAKILPISTILVAMYGQGKTRGMTAYLKNECATNQACACILPSANVNSIYLWKYFILSYEALRNLAKGGNQPNLNVTLIKNFKVLLPPLELQNQFADFVQKIDKSKVEIQKSLDKLEMLKKSLMQQYFG